MRVFAPFAVAIATGLAITAWLAGGARRRRVGTQVSRRTSAGTVLAVAVAVPTFARALDSPLAVIMIAAGWLWWAGQLAERGHLPLSVHRHAVAVAAVVMIAGGVRLEVSGVPTIDVVLTYLVIVLVTTSFRSSSSRDGQILVTAATMALAVVALAAFAHDDGVAGLAAATCGSALAFTAYVVPPVAARLRRGGAQFFGVLVAGLALTAPTSVSEPGSGAVALILVSLLLVEGVRTASGVGRRHGTDPATPERTDRWSPLVSSRTTSVAFVVGGHALVALLALLAGRSVLSVPLALTLDAVVLAAVTRPRFARRTVVRTGSPRWAFAIGGVVVAALAVLTIPTVLALLDARHAMQDAALAVEHGLAAARDGDTEGASAALAVAQRQFTDARLRLNDPLVSLARGVPVLGRNLGAGRELTAIGAELARTGHRLTTSANPQALRVTQATVPLDEARRLAPELASTTRSLRRAHRQVRHMDRSYLLPAVEGAIEDLETSLRRAVREGETARMAAELLPALFGGEGERHYFLAVQNNAEARATGGFIGNWGELRASDGRLELVRFERLRALLGSDAPRALDDAEEYQRRYGERFDPAVALQNVNVSPDLPTVGAVLAQILPGVGFGPVDGVVTVDPQGLAAILRVTGPVSVPGWPVAVTHQNVVSITLNEAYVRFATDQEAREQLLGDIADATWQALSTRDLGDPSELLVQLGRAARGKHVMAWFARPEEQRLAERARLDGAFPTGEADLTAVTTQNGAANKIDFYLRRRFDYTARLTPDDRGRVRVDAELTTELTNTAPATGLPPIVIGPYDARFAAGENVSYLSVYTPLEFESARLEGEEFGFEIGRELGQNVFSNFVTVPAGASRTVEMDLTGTLSLGRGRRYELALPRQAVTARDTVRLDLRVPSGWRFAQPDGLRISHHGRRARLDRAVGGDLTVSIAVRRAEDNSLWNRLKRGGDPADS